MAGGGSANGGYAPAWVWSGYGGGSSQPPPPGRVGGAPRSWRPLGRGLAPWGLAEDGDPLNPAARRSQRAPKEEARSTRIKAQATSWALYYFLAKDHPTELRKFLDALATLPRDLPLDGDTVLATFCKSFNLDGNKESLTKFANEWLDYIRTVPPAAVVPDIPLADPKPNTGPGGMGPSFPGGGSGDGGGDR